MNMRNETCVETQTSKVPTRVAFLFISILCLDDHDTSNGRIIIDDTIPLQALSRQSRREPNTAHSITPLNNYQSIPTRITQRKSSRKYKPRKGRISSQSRRESNTAHSINSEEGFRSEPIWKNRLKWFSYYY